MARSQSRERSKRRRRPVASAGLRRRAQSVSRAQSPAKTEPAPGVGPWPFFDDGERRATPYAVKAAGGAFHRGDASADSGSMLSGPMPRPAASDDSRGAFRFGVTTELRAVRTALNLNRPPGRDVVTLGWHPDVPDFRDLSMTSKENRAKLVRQRKAVHNAFGKGKLEEMPSCHENLRWCSPIENQGNLGSCTAQAVVGLMEFMQRRRGDYVDGSRLSLYKVTRNLLGWTGDTGAPLRTALKAVAAFGIPPEDYWPYDVSRFEDEPTAFLYSFAQNYQALEYTRLDDAQLTYEEILHDVKKTIASGLGVVFGLSVYSSLTNAPDIPFPSPADSLRGGHAVLAVGYDDDHVLPDANRTRCPALIIRNSWGPDWGIGGYGFLPMDYVLKGLTQDFWTVLKDEWLPLKVFN